MGHEKGGIPMKRTIAPAIFFFIFTAFIVGVKGSPAEAKTINLKFATFFSPKHNMQVDVWEPWAEKINELTKGQVKISMFPGGALGKPGDHYSLAEKGLADIAYILHDYTPGRFPRTTVFELPFMAPNSTKTSVAMWKTFEQSPEFRMEYDKVKLLALFCHPPGHFHTSKKPIRTIEDLSGLKVRTVSPAVTDALKLFGSIPVEMPITETYTAMERGVVDGTVIDWGGFRVFKLDDLTKYSTVTDFYVVTMAAVMNKRKWDKLPDDVKTILTENTGMSLSKWCGEAYDGLDAPSRARVKEKGIEIIELPEAAKNQLRQQTLVQRENWVKTMTAKGIPGQEILDTALKNLAE
jgi:TRAP-type C4-dicarboxylate transport system substrate-binding protein